MGYDEFLLIRSGTSLLVVPHAHCRGLIAEFSIGNVKKPDCLIMNRFLCIRSILLSAPNSLSISFEFSFYIFSTLPLHTFSCLSITSFQSSFYIQPLPSKSLSINLQLGFFVIFMAMFFSIYTLAMLFQYTFISIVVISYISPKKCDFFSQYKFVLKKLY